MTEDEMRDPQPGDFDAELELLGPDDIQHMDASSETTLAVEYTVRGEEAEALGRLADERGEDPSAVVASLIRAASGRAA